MAVPPLLGAALQHGFPKQDCCFSGVRAAHLQGCCLGRCLHVWSAMA